MFIILAFLGSGIAMWVVAWRLFSDGRKHLRETDTMRSVETSKISDAVDLPVDTPVEVKGTLRCEKPLKSEMAGHECAYYLSQVLREYETSYRGSDGIWHKSRHSEVLASDERFAPFAVQDGSGTVGIRAEGAEVDAVQVINRFENETGSERSFRLGEQTVRLNGGPRTIGYRYVESVLPPDARVYVLGTTGNDGRIGAATQADKRFLISHRSEEQLEKQHDSRALLLILTAVGLFLFGAVLLLGGLLLLIL